MSRQTTAALRPMRPGVATGSTSTAHIGRTAVVRVPRVRSPNSVAGKLGKQLDSRRISIDSDVHSTDMSDASTESDSGEDFVAAKNVSHKVRNADNSVPANSPHVPTANMVTASQGERGIAHGTATETQTAITPHAKLTAVVPAMDSAARAALDVERNRMVVEHINALRDLEDPDFVVSTDELRRSPTPLRTPQSALARRATARDVSLTRKSDSASSRAVGHESEIEVLSSNSVLNGAPKAAKRQRSELPHHHAYRNVDPANQANRDEILRQIRINWPAPAKLWPTQLIPETSAGVKLEPQDVSTSLTGPIAKLSSLSRGDPTRAHLAMISAVQARVRRGDGPSRLLKVDVEAVIAQFKQSSRAYRRRSSSHSSSLSVSEGSKLLDVFRSQPKASSPGAVAETSAWPASNTSPANDGLNHSHAKKRLPDEPIVHATAHKKARSIVGIQDVDDDLFMSNGVEEDLDMDEPMIAEDGPQRKIATAQAEVLPSQASLPSPQILWEQVLPFTEEKIGAPAGEAANLALAPGLSASTGTLKALTMTYTADSMWADMSDEAGLLFEMTMKKARMVGKEIQVSFSVV